MKPLLRDIYEKAAEAYSRSKVETHCKEDGQCKSPASDLSDAKLAERSHMYAPPLSYTVPHGNKVLSSETWKHAHPSLADMWTETFSHCRCVQRMLEAGASATWQDVSDVPVMTASGPISQTTQFSRYTQGVLDAYASGNQGLVLGNLGSWPEQADFGIGTGYNLELLLGTSTSLSNGEFWNNRQDR